MSKDTDDLEAAVARTRGEAPPVLKGRESVIPEDDIGAGIAAMGVENVATKQAAPVTKPKDFDRPVVNQISEVAGFRQLIAGYESFIDDIDHRNAMIDAEIQRLHDRALALLDTKRQNKLVRQDKAAKLAGVRQVVRALEDTDAQRLRASEDANTAELRQAEDAELGRG